MRHLSSLDHEQHHQLLQLGRGQVLILLLNLGAAPSDGPAGLDRFCLTLVDLAGRPRPTSLWRWRIVPRRAMLSHTQYAENILVGHRVGDIAVLRHFLSLSVSRLMHAKFDVGEPRPPNEMAITSACSGHTKNHVHRRISALLTVGVLVAGTRKQRGIGHHVSVASAVGVSR